MGEWRAATARLLSPAWKADHPLEIERGEGLYLIDRDGRRYMDFAIGYGAAATGHCHPRVVEAAQRQLTKLIHTSTTVHIEPVVQAAEKITSVVPLDSAGLYFLNGGSEAVDAAMKLARLYTGRPAFIAFRGAFHGRTLGAASLTTSKVLYRDRYEPLMPAVYFAPYADPYRSPYGPDPEACAEGTLAELERMFDQVVSPNQVAAIFVEPVQGEGGYVPAPLAFLRGLRRICDEHGILLVADEVQSGFGRTGEWFAIEHAGVTPDIMPVAKAVASGMPLSAVVARRDISDAWPAGAHGTTFGGNPVSCAAAVATIDVMQQEGLVENAAEQGAFLLNELGKLQQNHPMIGDVRGRGLMIGIEFVRADKSPWPGVVERIIARCREDGVILVPCGTWSNVIRLVPPLILTRDQAAQFLEIFTDAVSAE